MFKVMIVTVTSSNISSLLRGLRCCAGGRRPLFRRDVFRTNERRIAECSEAEVERLSNNRSCRCDHHMEHVQVKATSPGPVAIFSLCKN